MRKDKGDRKNRIRSRLRAYSTYQIEGLNLNNLLNHLARKKIELYSVKKVQNKRLILTVNYFDRKKLFAIAKELCYNIKKVKNSGRDLVFIRLSKRLGFLIGALFFVAITLTFNDLLLSVDYVGNGSVYKREVAKVLSQNSVGQFTRFSSLDLGGLEDEILSKSPNLSFVSLEKRGSRLVVELILADKKEPTLTGKHTKMFAECDGVIERLKVYRGTAVVKVGEEVKSGDLLVDGYAIIKEQKIEENVLAYVSILTEYKSEFISKEDGLERVALELIKNDYDELVVIDEKVKKDKVNDNFVYECVLTVRREYLVG